MSKSEQFEIKLFGNPSEGTEDVRADVFAKKIADLVKALRAADRHVNGAKQYEYYISDLKYGSTEASIAERPRTRDYQALQSSVQSVHKIIESIGEGRGIPKGTDGALANTIASLAKGSNKSFSHGEIGLKGQTKTVVRLDPFFDKKASVAYKAYKSDRGVSDLYQGVTFGTYDGVLKEVDLRGTIAQAKLILSAGGTEIDCVCNSITVDNLRTALNKRVIVNSLAHYEGTGRLPERIEIKSIKLVKEKPSLRQWRGQFELPYPSAEDVW